MSYLAIFYLGIGCWVVSLAAFQILFDFDVRTAWRGDNSSND